MWRLQRFVLFPISQLFNNIIVTNTEELSNKYYITNDIFELYKELSNDTDENFDNAD